MEYITTFDNVFFALCAFYATLFAVAGPICNKLSSGVELEVLLRRFQYAQWVHGGMWVVVLATAGYNSLQGMMSFMFALVVIVVGQSTYYRIKQGRRNQAEPVMVDLTARTGL